MKLNPQNLLTLSAVVLGFSCQETATLAGDLNLAVGDAEVTGATRGESDAGDAGAKDDATTPWPPESQSLGQERLGDDPATGGLHAGLLPELDSTPCPAALQDKLPTVACAHPDWCERLVDAPTTQAKFVVQVRPFAERGCLLAYAASLGVQAEEWREGYVRLLGSYAHVAPLLALDSVTYLDVGCPGTLAGVTCEQECSALGVLACKLSDHCAPYDAAILNEPGPKGSDPCVVVVELGCGASPRGCSEFGTTALDPQGRCYGFSNGCQPAGFVDTSSDPCGTYHKQCAD